MWVQYLDLKSGWIWANRPYTRCVEYTKSVTFWSTLRVLLFEVIKATTVMNESCHICKSPLTYDCRLQLPHHRYPLRLCHTCLLVLHFCSCVYGMYVFSTLYIVLQVIHDVYVYWCIWDWYPYTWCIREWYRFDPANNQMSSLNVTPSFLIHMSHDSSIHDTPHLRGTSLIHMSTESAVPSRLQLPKFVVSPIKSEVW